MLFPISAQNAGPVDVAAFLQRMPSPDDLVEAMRTDSDTAPRFIEVSNRRLGEHSRLSIKSQRWCLECLVKEADAWAAAHQGHPPDALDLGKLEFIATATGSCLEYTGKHDFGEAMASKTYSYSCCPVSATDQSSDCKDCAKKLLGCHVPAHCTAKLGY